MGRRRSLKSQLNYSITLGLKRGIGQSKRNQKRQGVNTSSRVYSNKTASKLRDFANEFSSFMKRYPEIKMVRDITPEHIQAFCQSKEGVWSSATRIEMLSRIKKIFSLAQYAFPGSNLTFADGLDKNVFKEKTKKEKIRNVAMTREDYEILRKACESSRSRARYAVGIAASIGCRVEELTSIRPDDIDLERNEVRLNNCKNGRNRTVAYDPKERGFFTHLIDHCRKNSWKTVVGDLKPAAVSRQIRRQIDKLYANKQISGSYENTTVHAIRKMYARERMCQELGLEDISELNSVPLEAKIRGWVRVQRDLGHGSQLRKELYLVYIGEPLK